MKTWRVWILAFFGDQIISVNIILSDMAISGGKKQSFNPKRLAQPANNPSLCDINGSLPYKEGRPQRDSCWACNSIKHIYHVFDSAKWAVFKTSVGWFYGATRSNWMENNGKYTKISQSIRGILINQPVQRVQMETCWSLMAPIWLMWEWHQIPTEKGGFQILKMTNHL